MKISMWNLPLKSEQKKYHDSSTDQRTDWVFIVVEFSS